MKAKARAQRLQPAIARRERTPERSNRTGNYGRTCEPPVPLAFSSLPPGAVEPTGWLRDWALAARNGITGHLDEWHPTYADGWKGVPIASRGAEPDGSGWPLEQSAYWLDGAIRLGLILHDKALIRKIRARLDPVVDSVRKAPKGTSFIYWKKKGFKPEGFNSWAHSHLGRAMVSLYQGTGDPRVLDALVKVYAGYRLDFSDGLCNLDPMLETYSYSGDRRILDQVLKAMVQPDIAKRFQDWNNGIVAPGHMVCLYENSRLAALAYPWTGDPAHYQATRNVFQWIDDHHMLPYGVSSGEEFASGVGAFRKTETCDVTAMLHTASWLYRIQGGGEWGDRMESAFFNAAPAPVARDFKTLSYYQSPNRLRSDSLPVAPPSNPGPDGNRFHRLAAPDVLCCVGAVNRIIPSYIIHMWMATRDNGLAATLYGPCTVSARVAAGVPVKLRTTTNYPFNETIAITVDPARAAEFPLYLRIPGWCKAARIRVNGVKVAASPDDAGFVRIARTWKRGDRVELRLPMAARVSRGYETEIPAANREYFGFQSEALFKPRRLPYASVLYGPLLFALRIPELDPDTPTWWLKWQYALNVDPKNASEIRVKRRRMTSPWDWSPEAPVALTVPARSFEWNPTDAQALPSEPVAGDSSESITLVPYGCTKFRISMFPVTPKTWERAPLPGS